MYIYTYTYLILIKRDVTYELAVIRCMIMHSQIYLFALQICEHAHLISDHIEVCKVPI